MQLVRTHYENERRTNQKHSEMETNNDAANVETAGEMDELGQVISGDKLAANGNGSFKM